MHVYYNAFLKCTGLLERERHQIQHFNPRTQLILNITCIWRIDFFFSFACFFLAVHESDFTLSFTFWDSVNKTISVCLAWVLVWQMSCPSAVASTADWLRRMANALRDYGNCSFFFCSLQPSNSWRCKAYTNMQITAFISQLNTLWSMVFVF